MQTEAHSAGHRTTGWVGLDPAIPAAECKSCPNRLAAVSATSCMHARSKAGQGGCGMDRRNTRRTGAVARLAVLALLATGTEAPAQVPDGLIPGGTATVTEVVDGDTVGLDDGREVRLVGLQAPKLPLGRPGFQAWPLAEEAKQVLESLVLGQQVALGYGGLRIDRHGRVLAHLFRIDNGVWIQRAMLAAGMARVYTFPDNRSMAASMLQAEQDARAAGRGIWALDFYAVRGVEDLEDAEDTFQLVEGTVHEVAEVRGRTYVNFGADYRSDFTLVIDTDARPAFETAGFALEDLPGRLVRARGWIDAYNGPMIDVTHPEQIELP